MFKFSLTAALVLGVAAPAIGQQSHAVSFADLNLSTPAGVAALDQRIDQAIRRVCGSAYPTDLGAVALVRQCRAETQASVSAQRNAVLVRRGSSGTIMASR